MPIPLANELRTTYGASFQHVAISYWLRDHILSFGDKRLTEKGRFAEEAGPEIMALKMLKGSRDGLRDLGSVILAESSARLRRLLRTVLSII